MDSSFLPGWLGSKLNVGDSPSRGNVAASWQWRELGMNPKGSASNTRILQEAAEDHLVNKAQLSERFCELPGIPKSTFLMVFSPDGTKVASTHGNHKIYVSELSSGKHVKTLSGHPRTPWCVAFHPSHPRLLGSGCLGGQVRVWDLSGGSEVWTVSGKTVIASIAFHPRDRLLVIATYNELYFWDWVHPQPFTKVQTNTIKEKVRFVSFDPLGHKLITGISVWSFPGAPGSLLQPSGTTGGTSPHHPSHGPSPNLPHEHISTYHHLLQRYDSLVRNYRHLFMARSQLNTTDRGTDPMEVDTTGQPSTSSGTGRTSVIEVPPSRATPMITSRIDTSSNPDNSDSDDASGGTGGSLNLDVQSISLGNTPVSRQSSQARHDIPNSDTMTFVTTSVPRVSYMAMPRERLFGSGASQSAFRPLSDMNPLRPGTSESSPHSDSEQQGRASSVPPVDRLPNPFSAPVQSPPIPSLPASNAANPNTNIRNELTASLNRLQGFMENSIDETLNIIERSDSARTSPMYSSMNVLREFPLLRNPTNASSRRLHMTPPTNSFVRNPQVYSQGTRPAGDCSYTTSHGSRLQRLNRNEENPQTSGQSSQQGSQQNVRQDPPQDVNFEQRFDSIGSMMRDSRIRLLNLITEFTEFSTIRRILQHYQQQRNTQANPNTTDSIRYRVNPQTPNVSGIFSSDDGSDSDRDMFSPLPLHIYRTRNWNTNNNPVPPYPVDISNLNMNNFEPTQTSSISMHIDDEDRHFRQTDRNILNDEVELPPGLENGRNILPFPTRFSNLSYRPYPMGSRNSNQLDIDAPSTSRQAQSQHFTQGDTQQPVHGLPQSPIRGEAQQPIHGLPHQPIRGQSQSTRRQASQSTQGQPQQPMQRQSQHPLQRQAQQPTPRTRTSSAPTPERSQRNTEGDNAFIKVTRGVEAIERHTEALVALCSTNVSRPPLRQLRRMWEDLRRVIVSIHHPSTPGQGPASCFSLSAHARCHLLNYMSSSLSDRNRGLRNRPPNDSATSRTQTAAPRQLEGRSSDNTASSNNDSNVPTSNIASGSQTSSELPSTSSGSRHAVSSRTRNLKTYPPSSRLRTSNFGFLPQDLNQSMRRRIRSLVLNRIRHTTLQRSHLSRGQRRSLRNRSPYGQELEISRDTIRFHARRVLALMFNIMMQCLEAEQLGNQIIVMLRSLKKALGLTCLLLMSQPFPNESHRSNVGPTQSDLSDAQTNQPSTLNAPADSIETNENTLSPLASNDSVPEARPSSSWIDRIAIQISAANRNHSSKAKKRQERYNIFKRSQALRNRNPVLRSHSVKKVTITAPDVATSSENKDDSPTPPPLEDSPVPSTSGLQRNINNSDSRSDSSPVPNSTPPSSGIPQSANARRIYSRMLFRRYLYNYGFMRDVVGVFRRPENQRNQHSSDVETPSFRPPYRPRIFSVRGSSSPRTENANRDVVIDSFISNIVVPIVRVNDVPVSEVQHVDAFPQPSAPPPPAEQPVIPQNIMSVDENGGAGILDGGPSLLSETPESPVHRIQVWDFTQGQLPDICNASINVVVQKCKIHNDASIDISRDGRLLVALLPAQRMRNITHRLGIYSLEWNCLGDCLYTVLLEQNAVSISLSPCARHLAVGLGSRRVSLQPYGRNGIMALIFRLGTLKKNDNNTRRGCLIPIRSLEQSWELGFTSLNCLRWAPQPGQGLVYANNTGQLKILS